MTRFQNPACRAGQRAPLRVRLASLLAVCFLLAGGFPAVAGTPPLEGVVNVNQASLEQLVLLPGVGQAKAQAIVKLRDERGGFESLDELTDVRGIGDAMLAKLLPHVRLTGDTTAQQP